MELFGLAEDKTQDYAQAQGLVLSTLADGNVITWNCMTQQNAEVTLGGSRTMANPYGVRKGKLYSLYVIQDSTGGRLITWGSAYKNTGSASLVTTGGYANFIVFRGMSDGVLEVISNATSTRA